MTELYFYFGSHCLQSYQVFLISLFQKMSFHVPSLKCSVLPAIKRDFISQYIFMIYVKDFFRFGFFWYVFIFFRIKKKVLFPLVLLAYSVVAVEYTDSFSVEG